MCQINSLQGSSYAFGLFAKWLACKIKVIWLKQRQPIPSWIQIQIN